MRERRYPRTLVLLSSRLQGRGGRETVIAAVVKELVQRGHDAMVAMLGPSDHPQWEASLPAVRVGPLRQGWDAPRQDIHRVLSFVRAVLREQRPDVVLVTEPVGALLVSAATPFAVPRVRPALASWLHGDPRGCRHAWALRLCDGHLALSAGAGEFLRARFRRPSYVVYNPVEVPEQGCPRPEAGDQVKFLYVGRIDPGKGVERILRALGQVRDAHWTLQVVGDGTLRQECVELTCALGISPRVTWSGWARDPWAEVVSASALLLASDSEGFPMVLLEALARGIPLVALDCDFGPREIIEPGANGWLVPKGDDKGLAALLGDLSGGRLNLPCSEEVCRTVERFRTEAVVTRVQEGLVEICRMRYRGATSADPSHDA